MYIYKMSGSKFKEQRRLDLNILRTNLLSELIDIICNYLDEDIPIKQTPFICDLEGHYIIMNDLYHKNDIHNGITITSSNVEIDGNKNSMLIYTPTVGIYMKDVNNVKLHNLNIYYNTIGIYGEKVDGLILKDTNAQKFTTNNINKNESLIIK